MRTALVAMAGMGLTVATARSVEADVQTSSGYTALIERLGPENVPDGEGVVVAMVEAPDTSNRYAPNISSPELSGHTFIDRSGGTPGVSSHANLVAELFLGETISMTPRADSVSLYEVVSWCLDDFLRANFASNVPPLATPGGVKVLNHSWIASFGSVVNDQLVLRRMDFAINRDEIIIVSGVANGEAHQPLLAYGFNNISVGTRSGAHATADTAAAYEGGGRMIPHLCAFGTLSSFTTPLVSSAAVLLIDQIRRDGLNDAGERPEVIKAVLMAAADHQDPGAGDGSWTNEPVEAGVDRGRTSRPLDVIQGAGQIDVDTGHRIMAGDRIFGGVSVPTTPDAPLHGWDLSFCLLGNSRTWNFSLPGAVEEVSVVAAWNRQVPAGFASWTLGDFDLELVRRLPDGSTESLIGAGSGRFGSGNVLSESRVDPVEHLYLRDLAAGDYQLKLSLVGGGVSSATAGIAWTFSEPQNEPVPGDLSGDGVVDVDDILILLSEFGQCGGGCVSDLDLDGDADVNDLLLLLGFWP